MKAKTMFLSRRHQRSRGSTFPNPDVAAHSMRPNGHVAGSLDDVHGFRLTGWIFDATNPNTPAKLRLLSNGDIIYEFSADVFRQDIASLAGNNGLNGFEIDLRNLLRRDKAVLSVKIELIDDADYYFGPIIIVTDPDASPLLGGQHKRLIAGPVEDQLQHIFTHITATFEENRQRLERLQGSVETLQKITGGSSALRLRTPSNLAQGAKGTTSGIGAFHSTELDEPLERELMAHRIEAQLTKIMLRT